MRQAEPMPKCMSCTPRAPVQGLFALDLAIADAKTLIQSNGWRAGLQVVAARAAAE